MTRANQAKTHKMTLCTKAQNLQNKKYTQFQSLKKNKLKKNIFPNKQHKLAPNTNTLNFKSFKIY